jgi:ribosome-associated heat shock protein Hsp15
MMSLRGYGQGLVSCHYDATVARQFSLNRESVLGRLRIDKWLWAARFFKTRSLAQQALEAGRVRLADERIKPSREIGPGDRLTVQAGEVLWQITVLQISERRGPAPEARRLYQEDAASVRARERSMAERALRTDPGNTIQGRPSKRDRRLIHRFLDVP